jgi:D-beta-D-heptose 7-phosphate kinase / D-beta-D-heptose 1-phosphate adenosyltransferase
LAISLDKDGILLFRNDQDYKFITTEVQEVFDVTGAGDVVVSVMGVLLAGRASPEMANIAAELEVSRMGVASIPWSEILNRLVNHGLSEKVVSLEKLKTELKSGFDRPLIRTNGIFDHISSGHLCFLAEINKISRKLIVAINSDNSIFEIKGSLPLLKEKDRANMLASLENIHRVVIFDKKDASEIIMTTCPDVFVKGEHF